MNEIRLAVVGPHRRGQISRMAHRPAEGFRLVAACALDLEGLEAYREECGLDFRFTTDYSTLVKDPEIDAIFVCSPDHWHAEHAVPALEAGKKVFLEKPMAITIADCDRILAAAGPGAERLYVGHNMRFFPVMRKIHELIAAGAIGRVEAVWCRHFISYGGDAYFRDWHSERRNTTGLLLQKGAHDLDMIHWFAGAPARRVVGMGKLSVYDKLPRRRPEDPQPDVAFDTSHWPPASTGDYSPVIDVEDHSMVLLECENGVQASYTQCHYTPDDQRNYTIIGTAGRIENFGDHSSPQNWASVHVWNRRSGYNPLGDEVFRIPPSEGTHGGADPLMIDDFLEFLRSGRRVGANPWEARMAVAVGVCATESLRAGSTPREIP